MKLYIATPINARPEQGFRNKYKAAHKLSLWVTAFMRSSNAMLSIPTMLGSHRKAATSNIELPRYTTKRFMNMINYKISTQHDRARKERV